MNAQCEIFVAGLQLLADVAMDGDQAVQRLEERLGDEAVRRRQRCVLLVSEAILSEKSVEILLFCRHGLPKAVKGE